MRLRLVAGYDVVNQADLVRRSIGVALQEAAIDPLMTGRELLRMQGALHGLRGGAAEERATSLLDRVGLVDAGDRRIGGYSGGMRRRSTSRSRSSTPHRALPRRADDRPRSHEPRGAVARGAQPQR